MPLVQAEPALQRSHEAEPLEPENLPDGQLLQAARLVKPRERPPVPAGQDRQAALEELPAAGL